MNKRLETIQKIYNSYLTELKMKPVKIELRKTSSYEYTEKGQKSKQGIPNEQMLKKFDWIHTNIITSGEKDFCYIYPKNHKLHAYVYIDNNHLQFAEHSDNSCSPEKSLVIDC